MFELHVGLLCMAVRDRVGEVLVGSTEGGVLRVGLDRE